MTLTRNLYNLDEVISALQTCLINGWPRAPFWVWELIASEEPTLAYTTLIDTWLQYGGSYNPGIASTPMPDVEDISAWVLLTLRIEAAIRSTNDINAIRFLNGAALQLYRPATTPLPKTGEFKIFQQQRAAVWVRSISPAESLNRDIAATWFIALDMSVRNDSRNDMMWLLQTMQPLLSADTIWLAIHAIAQGYGEATMAVLRLYESMAATHGRYILPQLQSQILYQANALLLLAAKPDEREKMLLSPAPTNPHYWITRVGTAKILVGRRAARMYTIPFEALHRGTTRGDMSPIYTNIDEIREPVPLLIDGCAFWRRVCMEAGVAPNPMTGRMEFPSDDVQELFIDRWFPDDIPDEWSAADQQKSHGRGNALTAPPPPPTVWVREEPIEMKYFIDAITPQVLSEPCLD